MKSCLNLRDAGRFRHAFFSNTGSLLVMKEQELRFQIAMRRTQPAAGS